MNTKEQEPSTLSEGPIQSGQTEQSRSPWFWPRLGLIRLLQGYKRYLSPLLPPSCRFTPTCAEYAIEAVGKYGVLKGSFLTCWRLLRCNPFCRGGYDPVP